MITEEILRNAFKTAGLFDFEPPKDAKESAVIVPFLKLNKTWHLIFEKKVNDNSKHAGQIAFPGGSRDKEDANLLETAIRETCEEIGVCKDELEILGKIKPTITLKTNFIIYPFAAIVKKYPPYKINKSEVEKLIFVPLEYLIKSYPFSRKSYMFNGKKIETLIVEFEGEIIWGATARILNNFIPLFKE